MSSGHLAGIGRRLVLATLAVLAFTGGTAAAERTVKLACVGDSITFGLGLGDRARDAYPAQLAGLLGSGWEVRNFGVSGATLMRAGDFPYARQRAHDAAVAWKADVVVIALGTNDTRPANIGAHPDDFVPSYHALIAEFRQANPDAKILLCLPPPVFVPGGGDTPLEKEILPRIRTVGSDEGLKLIDLHQTLENEAAHFPDHVHPDAEAAQAIAQTVYGEVMLATQPAAQSLDPTVNTAVVPTPRLERDSYNWWTRHATELAIGRRLNPDVVLIGDSITHFWAGPPKANHVNGPQAWAEAFGGRKVLNLGFGWDRTQNVLWRIAHGELDGLQPKLVILNIGTNNFSATKNARANTPEEVAAGIRAVCDAVRGKCPTCRLLVMGVLPRGHKPTDGFRAPITALNRLLPRVVADLPNATFLDIGARFLEADGSMPRALMPDGTHPSNAGYEIWARAIVETRLLP